jgi:hypothetical protein
MRTPLLIEPGELPMKTRSLTAAICLLAVIVTEIHADPLDPFRASLQFSRSGFKADLSYRLENNDGQYRITTSTKAKGAASLVARSTVTETADFSVRDGLPLPGSYRRDDGTKKGEENASVEFDWDRGIATGTSEGRTEEFEVSPGGTFDTLTAELATRIALAGGDQSPEFDVIEGSELKRYRFDRVGEDTVSIDGKEYRAETFDLDRQSRRITRYWFVPELDYAVARMEQRAGEDIKGTVELVKLK